MEERKLSLKNYDKKCCFWSVKRCKNRELRS